MGKATKARDRLGRVPRIRFAELIKEMAEEGLRLAERDELVRQREYQYYTDHK